MASARLGSRYGQDRTGRAGASTRLTKAHSRSAGDERTARILLTAQEAIRHAHAQETLPNSRAAMLRRRKRVQRGAAVARVQSYLRIPRC